MYDAIIVGSGPAGVATALALRPMNVLMLDVGLTPPEPLIPAENVLSLREKGFSTFEGQIGNKFETLETIDGDYISPKLKPPLMRYVWKQPDQSPKTVLKNFDPVVSYAQGGLANAWGAGLYRFSDVELKDFPFDNSELNPFYDELTAHIGISGADDDLSSYFGSTDELLPPFELSPLIQNVFTRYEKNKSHFSHKGIKLGRPRSAVLSREHNNRPAYKPLMQDFFQAKNPSIYNPAFTLQELLERNELQYAPGNLVVSFKEANAGVEVVTKDISSDRIQHFKAKSLFLAAGAINTTRIVLESFDAKDITLPILENPVSFVPFVDISSIGSPYPRNHFQGGELIALKEIELPGVTDKTPVQASMYGLNGPLRSDLIAELPLSMKSNLWFSKYVSPALGMLQIFYPAVRSDKNFLARDSDGNLLIQCDEEYSYGLEKQFLSALHRLLLFASKRLCKFPMPGSSIHYAGTLPMKASPASMFECDRNGKLQGTEAVYISDAANFPSLPSKSHSLTIMANAMRIANLVRG